MLRYLKSVRIPWTTGYSDYKYDFLGKFLDSKELAVFKDGPLPSKYGYRMDERFVEYPWFFSRLKAHEMVILDAGSVLNFKEVLSAEKLKSRKLYISTLFFEGRPDVQPSPSYIYEDLRDMCFKDDFFDAICSLSTVEHIGFDNTMIYTPDLSKKENDKFAHLAAIKEYRRVLKKDGTLYLSVPFGAYRDHGWFQVFDAKMINGIIAAFQPSHAIKTFFRYENDQWNFSSEDKCLDGYCFDIRKSSNYEADYLAFSRCVACLEMTK
jgi:SAM-dependent methyltransferase